MNLSNKKIIRIISKKAISSAKNFESYFKEFVQDIAKINYVYSEEISNDLENFLLNENHDFFSPGYGAFHLLPALLKLRNKFNLKNKLLFIAHAAGMHNFELLLSYNLLRNNDIIICPSKRASNILKFFFQGLNIITIPHPIILENHKNLIDKEDNLIVSMSRIHPDKLIHKVIEAIKILKDQNFNIKYIICGDTNIPNKNEETQYTKILKYQIKNFKLENNVEFVGEVQGEQKKEILKKAKILINLSVSPEESFGKSIMEGILTGTPVIYTNWDGFPETSFNCGIGVNVNYENNIPNINEESLAQAIKDILNSYEEFHRKCLVAKRRYNIEKIKKLYNQALTSENNLLNRDKSNILKLFPFLNELSEDEILELKDEPLKTIQSIIFLISRRFINFLQTGKSYHDSEFSIENKVFKKLIKKDFYYRLISSIKFKCYQYSKEAILYHCLTKIEPKILEEIFYCFFEQSKKNNNVKFLHIEILLQKKEYYQAFQLWQKYFKKSNFKETDYLYLKQLSKICRAIGEYEYGEKILSNWLEQFPYSIYLMYIVPELFILNIKMKKFNNALKYLNLIKIFAEDKLLIKKFEEYYENNKTYQTFF